MTERKNEIWDPLSAALGIESELRMPEPVQAEVTGSTTEIEVDYGEARQNVLDTLVKASDALDEAMRFAKSAQTARAYEVVGTLIKVVLDGNKDLLELSKKKVDIHNAEGGDAPKTINNTMVINGSTAALQKILQENGIETLTRVIQDKDNSA